MSTNQLGGHHRYRAIIASQGRLAGRSRITIRDKVEGERAIPLTPADWWSPASPTAKPAPPQGWNTLHGLRRSFASLTEWLETPAGVVAQIQGHKPSATAEKHYKRRPLDLLRVHHERIEAWILEQAGVQFDATTAPDALRVVA